MALGGAMVWRSSITVSPLGCAVTKNVPASPLECAVIKLLDLKSFRISSYKNVGGGVTNVEGGGRTKPFSGITSGRGAEVCWVRKLLRRGYDAAPVEDLHFDRVAGDHPWCVAVGGGE